jgi:hypothetical protein
LGPDQPLSVDCEDVSGLFNTTSSVGDGFVVLKSDVELDVSAVYTTNISIEVEYIKPTIREIDELPPPQKQAAPICPTTDSNVSRSWFFSSRCTPESHLPTLNPLPKTSLPDIPHNFGVCNPNATSVG